MLARTTFGPSYADIYDAADEGIENWLDRQFAMSPSLHEPIVRRYLDEYGFDINANPPPGTFRRFAFYEQALTAPDQLRQLVAYALTQIFVVSDNPDMIAINPLALSSYYDMLLRERLRQLPRSARGRDLAPGDGSLPLPREQRQVQSGHQHLPGRELRSGK